MTSKTHKVFAISWVIVVAMFVFTLNISKINYYLSLIIMISMGKAGALFPDVDHNWQSVKEKTTVNWIINKIIRLTGGKHRSWQTHSWDIWLVFTVGCKLLSEYLLSIEFLDRINYEVVNIVVLGFSAGWMSHLVSDMMTSDGVRLFCWSKKKIAFVPKQLNVVMVVFVALVIIATGLGLSCILFIHSGWILVVAGIILMLAGLKLGNIRFNTGHEWEECVFKFMRISNTVIGIASVIYPLLVRYYSGMV